MSELYSVADIRKIEQAALSRAPEGSLMRKAGERVAEKAEMLLREGANVLVLAGPGNNGGDALHAANHLASHGKNVTALLFADRERQSKDAQQAADQARHAGVQILTVADSHDVLNKQWHLVIDGLFGIGLSRPIPDAMRGIIEAVNTLDCPVLSIDVPSGLDADNGNVIGGQDLAIRATHTLTFIADKPGLHTGDGRDFTGEVQVDTLGIDESLFPSPSAFLNDTHAFRHALVPRRQNTHKGSFGNVMVAGGASGMAGAVILAARAAAKCGAGKVYAGFLSDPPSYDSLSPELMCRATADMDFAGSVAVLGPGLGTADTARHLLDRILATPTPLVLDADALNILSQEAALQNRLRMHECPLILTPHPLEAARLLQTTGQSVQADRLVAAREIAARLNAIVILKGSGTVIARPDGIVSINITGNPGLATAGTGDVLAGTCGALLAQHMPAWEAALAAVWLHGRAGDLLAARIGGTTGLTAGELIPEIRLELNRLISSSGKLD